MANRPKSVYLTARSMSALRESDSLSGRMNQIADRYLEMVRADGERVRERFLPLEWEALARFVADDRNRAALADDPRAALEQYMRLMEGADGEPIGGPGIIEGLTGGDLVVLLELLEADTPTR